MTLNLPPDIEGAIQEAARHQGQTPEEAVTAALRRLFTPASPQSPIRTRRPYDPAAAMALLDSFDQGDEDEQRETLNTLVEAIDRDRPSQRRIFGEGINPMEDGLCLNIRPPTTVT